MPQVILGAAIGAAASAIASWALGATLAAAMKYFAINFVLGAALGYLTKKDAESFQGEAIRRQQTIKSPIEPRRIVVGESVVSGPLVAYFSEDVTFQRPFAVHSAVIPSVSSGSPVISYSVGLFFLLTPGGSTNSFVSDQGVDLVTPEKTTPTYTPAAYVSMVKVGSNPAAGQYSVDAAGLYTFNTADRGKNVRMFFTILVTVVQKDWHWFVIPLSHGEIAEIGEVFLNDEPVGPLNSSGLAITGKFSNHVKIKKYLGTQTQTADPDLIAASGGRWTTADRGIGVAYMIVALKRDAALWTEGVPNMKAYVRGALFEDTRDSVTRWTNNPASIIRGYIKAVYGLSSAADEVLDSLVSAAANACDERVALADYTMQFSADPVTETISFASPDNRIDLGDKITVSNTGGSLPGGLSAATDYYVIRLRDGSLKAKLATSYMNALAGIAIDITSAGTGAHTAALIDQARYTCDGTINLEDKPIDILEKLLTSMAGACIYSMGSWRLFAGVYAIPDKTFTPTHLRGDMEVRARAPRKELFNAIRGTYVDPFKAWQPGDFPPVENSSYAGQDGGGLSQVKIERNIELPYTINSTRAQRIAKIHLEKSRQQIIITAPFKFDAMSVAVWDTFMFTDADLGWTDKVFRCTAWELSENGRGVGMIAQEDAAASYDWNAGEETLVDPTPDTDLPDSSVVIQPGVPVVTEELYETTGSAGVKARVILSCDPSPSAFTSHYQFEYKSHGDLVWIKLSVDTQGFPRTSIEDITPGFYDFQVLAVNHVGAISAYTAIFGVEVKGLTDPPSDVTNFEVRSIGGSAMATLTRCPDLDVRIGGKLWVRHTPLMSGATWNDGVLLNPDGYPGDTVSVFVPLASGTYMAKFEDSSFHPSVNAASFVITEAQLTGFSTLFTLAQHSAFAGAKVSVAIVDGGLQVTGATMIDDFGDIDDVGDIDYVGGIATTGSYTFATKGDLGTVQAVRLFPHIKSLAFVTTDLIDSRTDLIDLWGMFDGDVVEDAEVELMIRITNDDPNGSPTWGPWHALLGPADYNTRGFEFRLDWFIGDPTHNRRVTELSVAAKQPV